MAIELPPYIDEKVRQKLDKVIGLVSKNLPEQPDEAFCNVTSGDRGFTYPEVWLFTPRLVVEIRNPLSATRIQHDLASFANIVDWIRLTAHDYDFERADAVSKLELEFTTTDGLSGTLSAVGEGCTDLMKVYRDKFLPNFTGTQVRCD